MQVSHKIKHAKIITSEMVAEASENLDTTTPKGLQNVVIMQLGVCLQVRPIIYYHPCALDCNRFISGK